jgi:hypothetical protein
MRTILTKTFNVLHCRYYNICTPIVTHCTAVCFKEMVVLAPSKCRDNKAETCRRSVKVCMYKL